MSQVVEVQLRWDYTPKNYIEEPIQIEGEGYQLSISEGVALAQIALSTYERNSGIQEDLTSLIENRLHAVQLMAYGNFTLSRPSRSDLREDGRKTTYLELELTSTSTASTDIKFTDRDGDVFDSKQDRLNKQVWFAKMLDKYRSDDTLNQMLKSRKAAASELNNELARLYEIKEALKSKSNKARKKLSIGRKEWSRLGCLANEAPLQQGRHRGKMTGKLRDATETELRDARKIARSMIEAYLNYLESNSTKS